MTQFTNKSFSIPCSSGTTSEEELARRWEATFGKKKDQAKDEADEKKQDESAKKEP